MSLAFICRSSLTLPQRFLSPGSAAAFQNSSEGHRHHQHAVPDFTWISESETDVIFKKKVVRASFLLKYNQKRQTKYFISQLNI